MSTAIADVKRKTRERQQGRGDRPALRRGAAQDGRLLAGLELPVGRPDLSARQSAPETAAQARAHQAAALGPLGHVAGPEHALRPPQPGHQARRPEHDLHHRPGARRPVAGGPCLPGRHLQRGVSEHQPGRRRDEAAVQAVQLSPAAFPATSPRRRRAAFTKAASSATR